MKDLHAIILAAGKGTRMKSDIPKVLHQICGKPILEYVLDIVRSVSAHKTFVVIGYKNEAVKELIRKAVAACKKAGKYSGICGQGPSDFPDFAEFLVGLGIESISLNPDSIIKTTMLVAEKEKELNSNNA